MLIVHTFQGSLETRFFISWGSSCFNKSLNKLMLLKESLPEGLRKVLRQKTEQSKPCCDGWHVSCMNCQIFIYTQKREEPNHYIDEERRINIFFPSESKSLFFSASPFSCDEIKLCFLLALCHYLLKWLCFLYLSLEIVINWSQSSRLPLTSLTERFSIV